MSVFISSGLLASPFFDVHLHYSEGDAKVFSTEAIVEQLDKNRVRYAAVTGSPAVSVSNLYAHAPDRIVPLLSVYRTYADKESWTQDETVHTYVEKELKKGYWRGVGELHVFAKDRHSPVFRKVVNLAAKSELPLMLHADPAVIDTLYEMSPKHPVIWAHAGTFPYPDLLADYLSRYPELHIDLSMRDERVAPGGVIADEWYELFVTFPDRFMVGVDTYSSQRWRRFEFANRGIRQWLKQLPEDVAGKLAYENAVDFFSVSR